MSTDPPARPDPESRDFEFLRYVEDGPVARITLDRPQKRNALSMALSDELVAAIEIVDRSTAVKVLVVGGPATRSAPATTSPRCTAGATPTASRAACASISGWPTRSRSSTR